MAKAMHCLGEPGEFPKSEFKETKNGWVHMTDSPHYTNGLFYEPPIPGRSRVKNIHRIPGKAAKKRLRKKL